MVFDAPKCKKFSLKLSKSFVNKIGNYEIFRKNFRYQNPPFLAKELIKANQARIEHILNLDNYALIDLRNAINKKTITENKDPDTVTDIVEKIMKGLISPKQMF